MKIKYPFLFALFSQVISLIIIKFIFSRFEIFHSGFNFTLLQALLSMYFSQYLFKLPRWFFYISFIIPWLFYFSHFIHINASIYGIVFVILALTFSHTLKERVPLYLSNKTTFDALKKIVEEKGAKNFLDLGSGLGGVVRAIGETKTKSYGVESAPLLFLYSKTISLFSNGKISRTNIWDVDLSNFDVVYAFLSPAVMEKLYQKVKSEMKQNSTFVSNSFLVPEVTYDEIWELDDERKTKLYFYKIN